MGKFKKIIIGLFIVCIVAVIIGIVFGQKQDFHLTQDTLALEYGDVLPENFDEYIETDGDIENIEYSSQDIDDFQEVLPVGEYTVDFTLGDKTETLQVHVEDTTAPQVTLSETVKTLQNHEIDYKQYISVEDLSAYEITVQDQDVIYNKPGQYQAKICVKDLYDNETNIDVPVIIEEVTLKASKSSMTLKENDTQTLNITTNSRHPVTYTSTRPDVATVDESGHIHALKAGSTTITASVDGKTETCRITVPAKQTNTHNTTKHHEETLHSTTTANDNIGETVYITKTGSKYHRDGCRYLRKSQIAISLSDAKNRGYSACSVCF